MIPELKRTSEQKMQKSLEALKADLAKVRTGRAHTGILDHVQVPKRSNRARLPSLAMQLPVIQSHSAAPLMPMRCGSESRRRRLHDTQQHLRRCSERALAFDATDGRELVLSVGLRSAPAAA